MEQDPLEWLGERLGALRSDHGATIEVRRDVASQIGEVLGKMVISGGIRLMSLRTIAEKLGLTDALEGSRRGMSLKLKTALAERLSFPPDEISIPDGIAECLHVDEQSEDVFVPPDEGKPQLGAGESSLEEKEIIPRTKLILEIAKNLGFRVDMVRKGKVTDKMMRKKPYNLVVMKERNRLVLVCDEEDNRTFVIYTAENEEEWPLKGKEELKSDPKVAHVVWNSNEEIWKQNIRNALLADGPKKKRDSVNNDRDHREDATDIPETSDAVQRMDKEYFENPENVRADLEGYVAQLGEGKTPLDLSTDNMSKLTIKCVNGEEVRGVTYILRAGVALGYGKNVREANSQKSEILKRLLNIAGYEVMEYPAMDKEYFENPENVRADLEGYVAQLGEGKTPLDLSTDNMPKLTIKCANGKKVNGVTYILRAGVALGYGKNAREANSRRSEILKKLLNIAGYEVMEYPAMDKEYFENPENVRADLGKYAAQLGEDKTPLDLSTKNMQKLKIGCANGEDVKGDTYILRAGVALEYGKNVKEAKSQVSRILKRLNIV